MAQEETIKGRIAEAIVRCMFEDLGFEVVPYGYEHTAPTLARKDKVIKGEVKDLIRKAPDFIVVDKDSNAHFIEVKYRHDGKFKKEVDYPYRDCWIILLTDTYIGMEQYKNLDEETTLEGINFMTSIEGSFKSITSASLFKQVNSAVVKEYREVLMKYMKNNGTK